MPSPTLPPGFVLIEPKQHLGRRAAAVLLAVLGGGLFVALFAGFVVAVVLGIIALGLAFLIGQDAIRAVFGWHRPQLQVASQPYALGSVAVVTYHRRPRRVTDVADFAVECEIVCQEAATYTNGSDTTTDTRDVYRQRCDGRGEGTATGLVAEAEVPISAYLGGPTMHLPDNRIRWFVEIQVRGQRLPKDTHTFEIQVAPVLDPSLRLGLQDT